MSKKTQNPQSNIGGVSARSLSEMTTEELNKEIAFIDDFNPSNSTQLNTLIDYASKIKAELNVR